jgi:holo-[acyl-carrier protein] synthase
MNVVGVGIDIIELTEVQASVLARPRMRARVFTRGELAYCRDKARPLEHLAARFAAKEAVFKALGTGWTGRVRWHDAEVVATAGKPPELVLRGALAKQARVLGATELRLSLTHSGNYAAAVVVASARR